MLALLKLLQSLVKTLHSDGAPWQVATGLALGAALGLTPIANVHNVLVLAVLMLLNVSFGAGLLGFALFTPLGFALDPLFDRVGRRLLLETPSLQPLWTEWYNSAWLPWTNFNNTVVLGSVVVWAVLFLPLTGLAWWFVLLYRRSLGARIEQSPVMRAIKASKLYNVYRWFDPE
jgi:uncharacterized protein (TIGR03546 family)